MKRLFFLLVPVLALINLSSCTTAPNNDEEKKVTVDTVPPDHTFVADDSIKEHPPVKKEQGSH